MEQNILHYPVIIVHLGLMGVVLRANDVSGSLKQSLLLCFHSLPWRFVFFSSLTSILGFGVEGKVLHVYPGQLTQ